MTKSQKIFVTGGAGFIGRHLVKSLLENTHEVTIFDDFSNSSKENISNLTKLGAQIIEGSIVNYDFLLNSMNDFDVAIHLAAITNVPKSISEPRLTHEVNVTGTFNLLHSCVQNNIKNVVGTSSAAVYGDCKDLPLSENSPTIPTSPYGATKLILENYMQAFSRSYGLNCISLRLFNVYGQGQSGDYAGVIVKFLENISKSKPLTIFGDGSFTRDFVSIDDVVQAFQNAMTNIETKQGNYYNIASGRFISIKELAETILELSNKKLEIQYKPALVGDIPHSQTTIFLAKKELNYQPQINLKDGLEQLLKSYEL